MIVITVVTILRVLYRFHSHFFTFLKHPQVRCERAWVSISAGNVHRSGHSVHINEQMSLACNIHTQHVISFILFETCFEH